MLTFTERYGEAKIVFENKVTRDSCNPNMICSKEFYLFPLNHNQFFLSWYCHVSYGLVALPLCLCMLMQYTSDSGTYYLMCQGTMILTPTRDYGVQSVFLLCNFPS